MNSQELKCFVVAADRLNFTRAAKELYVTPPTVTHHIQHLEDELGVKLFIRDSKSVQLTTAGEIFYHDAHDILLRMEEIPNRLKAVKMNGQRILKIGRTMKQDTKFLTQTLHLFHQENPMVSPRIYLDDYFQLINRLVENQLDFIMGTKAMIQDRTECQFQKLFTCSMKAIIPKEIVIIDQDIISINDLQDYSFITLRQKSIPKLKEDELEHFLSAKTREKNVIRQDDVEAVLALTLSGYGIGLLPEYAFCKEDLDETVQVVDIQESLEIDYGIIYLKKDKNLLVREFIKCLNSFL